MKLQETERSRLIAPHNTSLRLAPVCKLSVWVNGLFASSSHSIGGAIKLSHESVID